MLERWQEILLFAAGICLLIFRRRYVHAILTQHWKLFGTRYDERVTLWIATVIGVAWTLGGFLILIGVLHWGRS